MKHTLKITLILLTLFLSTQLIGLLVINQYSPQVKEVQNLNGTFINKTTYNLPYSLDPPENTSPESSLISIIFALIFAVFLMLFLIKFKVEHILRTWFFIVIVLSIAITLNSFMLGLQYSQIIALILAFPLAFLKVFKRNIIVHNLTELIIYPGIASIFVPILTIWSVILLLIFISIYDMYAVWHAGFMQKMAKYQIQKLRIFSGFFIPYLGKKEKELYSQSKRSNSKKSNKKVKLSVAILGGGDVVFPIILAGVVFNNLGFFPAILISLGATLALGFLFYMSKKGKFYPAMPFITIGCLLALGIASLIN
ncbi:MAG: presenilin family intramembrane aspartyl protease [Nanoarchaeota archaeon]